MIRQKPIQRAARSLPPPPRPTTLVERERLLSRYLELGCQEAARRKLQRPDWAFGTYEEFVSARGVSFRSAPRPDGIERGLGKRAYWNVLDVVRAADGRLVYVEGYAVPPEASFPFLHAWACTIDGDAVDPTWHVPEQTAYRGVPFPLDEVERFYARATYYGGFFEFDHLYGFPLLRAGNPFPPEDETDA